MKLSVFLKENLVPALFGGFAIFLTSYMIKLSVGSAILFASLGASTVICSEFPEENMAKLRVVLTSYFFAALVGYLSSFINYLSLAAGVAVTSTILLMLITKNIHPPAGGIALAFVFYSRHFFELIYVMLSIFILLVLLKTIVYFYKKEMNIKKFHHEFLK